MGRRNVKKLPKGKQKSLTGKKVKRIGTGFSKHEAFFGEKQPKKRRTGQKGLFEYTFPKKSLASFMIPDNPQKRNLIGLNKKQSNQARKRAK